MKLESMSRVIIYYGNLHLKKILILFLLRILMIQCDAQDQAQHDQIVLVNVEHLDRAGIAKEILAINHLGPKVIALDVTFEERHNDENDAILAEAISECESLVTAGYVRTIAEKVFLVSANASEFMSHQGHIGFIDTMHEKDEYKTQQQFKVWEEESLRDELAGKPRTGYHFSVETVMAFDRTAAMMFVKSRPQIVDIDFKDGKRTFLKFSASDVLDGKISRRDIEGKIVMLGFLGPGNEDKSFTRLNKGERPSEPDMYGVEILANITAQILESK